MLNTPNVPGFTEDPDIDLVHEVYESVAWLASALQYRDAAEAVGKAMSCHEAERLAQVFRTAGFDEVGNLLVREHAVHDTDMLMEDVTEWHGDEVTRCPKCLDHPGWAHGDESRRAEPADLCRHCLGSGSYLP